MDDLFKEKKALFDACEYGERRLTEAIEALQANPKPDHAIAILRWSGYTSGAAEARVFKSLKWDATKILKFHAGEADAAFHESIKSNNWDHYTFTHGVIEGFEAKMGDET